MVRNRRVGSSKVPLRGRTPLRNPICTEHAEGAQGRHPHSAHVAEPSTGSRRSSGGMAHLGAPSITSVLGRRVCVRRLLVVGRRRCANRATNIHARAETSSLDRPARGSYRANSAIVFSEGVAMNDVSRSFRGNSNAARDIANLLHPNTDLKTHEEQAPSSSPAARACACWTTPARNTSRASPACGAPRSASTTNAW